MSDTEQQLSQQSLTAEAKERAKERARQGVETGATQAGQKAGSLAQALRNTGEQMREQGQEGQAKLVDQVARRAQLAGGYLSQSNSESLLSDAKQARAKARERTQQLRQQGGTRLREQIDTRRTQAGERATSLAQALRTTGEQLRGQGEETQAKVIDRLAERAERLGGYLSASDAERILGDLRSFRQRATSALSQRTQTVAEKQRSVTSKGTGVVKERAKGIGGTVREKPVRFALGALAGGFLAARGLRRRRQQPPQEQQTVEVQAQAPVTPAKAPVRTELEGLTKQELMNRALAAGLPVRPGMTKRELVDALTSERVDTSAPDLTVVDVPPTTTVDQI